MTTTVDVLRAARELIDTPDKWVKGKYGTADDGAFCAYGAMDTALTASVGADEESETWTDTDKVLRGAVPEPYANRGYIAFNDHPDTTHADILALYDRAIASAEAKVAAP